MVRLTSLIIFIEKVSVLCCKRTSRKWPMRVSIPIHVTLSRTSRCRTFYRIFVHCQNWIKEFGKHNGARLISFQLFLTLKNFFYSIIDQPMRGQMVWDGQIKREYTWIIYLRIDLHSFGILSRWGQPEIDRWWLLWISILLLISLMFLIYFIHLI